MKDVWEWIVVVAMGVGSLVAIGLVFALIAAPILWLLSVLF